MSEKEKTKKQSDFMSMIELDVSEYTKKNESFDYLPWTDALQLMKEHDEKSQVVIREFEHWEVVGGQHQDFLVSKELPYQKANGGSYVEVSVIFDGKEEIEVYPVLDSVNQDVAEPTMSQVNKALKRAFVKALAKHGLGLSLYKGEDIPKQLFIDLKELEKVEKVLEKLNSLVGEDTTESMINRLNKWTAQNYQHLSEVNDIKEMTKEHSGLFLRLINEATQKAEAVKKEKSAANKKKG